MLCPTESHLSGLMSSRIWLFPPTKGNITQFTLMKQQFPPGEYPSMEEMTRFVLTPLLKSWIDYLPGCPTWSILQRPYLQGANVYANLEQETPKGFSVAPWEALQSPAWAVPQRSRREGGSAWALLSFHGKFLDGRKKLKFMSHSVFAFSFHFGF